MIALLAGLLVGLRWTPLGEPGSGGAMTDLAASPHDPKLVFVCGDMLGLGRSADGGETWGAALGLRNYEVAAVTFHPTDPNVVWVGTMGGPHVSADGGKTWTLRREGMPPASDGSYTAPIQQVLFDPNDPKRLIATGGSSRRWDAYNGRPAWGAVWESRDGGARWAQIGQVGDASAKTDPGGSGRNLVAAAFAARSSTRLYGLVNNAGFWRSDDGGKNWARKGTGIAGANVQRLQTDPKDPNLLWVSTGPYQESGAWRPGGIWESRDGGTSFHGRNEGLSQAVGDGYNLTAGYTGFAVSPKDPRFMATSDGAWNTGVIYVTQDGGAHWKPVATKGNLGRPESGGNVPKVATATFAGLAASEIEIAPTTPPTILACNTEWIVKSADGGATWHDASSHPAGGGWAGNGYSGWCSRQVRFDPFVKGRVMLQAMDAGRAWISQDGMKSWRYGDGFPDPWNGGDDGGWAKGGRVYGAYGQFDNFGGVGRSDDGGHAWTVVAGKEHGLPEFGAKGADPSGIVADPERPDRVWLVAGGDLYASADGAKSFRRTLAGRGLSALAFENGKVYATGDQGLNVSPDGSKWEALGGPKPARRLAVAKDGTVYVVSPKSERAGLWRYAAGRWTRLLDEYFAEGVAVDPKDASRLIVTTAENPYRDTNPAVGVWASSDGGASWSLQNDGLPVLRGTCAGFDPFSDAVVFGSYGRGFWRASWPVAQKLAGDHRYATNADDAKFAEVSKWGSQTPILVRNPSMSDGGAIPASWDGAWTGRGKLIVARDTATFHSAPASLRVESRGDTQGQAYQTLDAPGGARFRLSGWMKTAGHARVNAAVQSFGGDWRPLSFQQAGYAQNDTGWTRFEKEITLPPGTSRFGIVLLLEGEGKAWLDDVAAEPIP